MSLFTHKTKESQLTDVNAGAASMTYQEVRPRNSPNDDFKSATTLQFDFSAPGRNILLNESYFEVKFKIAKTAIKADGDADAVVTYGDSIPITSIKPGTGAADGADVAGSLRARFLNQCIASIRHSINGSQVSSTNDPVLSALARDTQQSHGYDNAASSAFLAQSSLTSRSTQILAAASKEQQCLWQPALGLWSNSTAIPSADHTLQIDMYGCDTYSARVWEFGSSIGVKEAGDFNHTSATSTNARERYWFAVEEIVLKLCTVRSDDNKIASPSYLLETMDVECARIDIAAASQSNKMVALPGTTYKTGVAFLNTETNSYAKGNSLPETQSESKVTNLSMTVDGNQFPSPEYRLVATQLNMSPYADYLLANGSLYHEVGMCKSILDWTTAPIYMQRIVQPPSQSKEMLLRCNFGESVARTVAVMSFYTKAILLEYDAAGICRSVSVNEYA